MKAAGNWTWWNQYGSVPFATCIARAKQCDGVIVKWGYPQQRNAFRDNNIPWATERYVYPNYPEIEGLRLADDIAAGARFAVVNAEVEWDTLDGSAMALLLDVLQARAPGVEIYASIDTRGNRTRQPSQRELIRRCTGIMPMIYPKAFRPAESPDFVEAAFRDCLDTGQDFQSKPVLPTLQAYDQIGAEDVIAQVREADRRGLTNVQLYTLAHATDAEWAAFAKLTAHEREAMATQADLDRLTARIELIRMFTHAADTAAVGERLPRDYIDGLIYVLSLAKATPR